MKTGSASTSEERLIPNELLCYAFAYSNCSAIGSLVNCICEFYQPDEIAAARELLWKECEKCPNKKASADPSHLVHEALPNQSLVQNNSSSTTMGNRKDTTIAPLSEKRVQFAERAAPTDNPREPDLERSWTTVVKTSRRRPLQVKQRLRAAAKLLPSVVGIGETDTEIKSCRPLKQLFVYCVDSVCDADALKGFMDKQGVRPKQVHRVSKATWLRASFQVRQAKFWPSGVMCREWLNSVPKKPPQDNSNFEDVFGESFAHDDADAEEDEHKNDDGNDT
ncbi:hypothetical protein CAPTEDRAFT_188934 [Capitella teleta]|uniref:Uncharacterized protein n=1 Tax=Capitella teleta TaxID=283909 RepID=R7U3X3_CAPTE|nr:hypothetical protein CAPTEDRAFT_188934 [Capitella teleta]|eukprot:ELU00826.1 hypothetical protein CAPTEDRAFT_188934 [Capitella teleta]